VGEGDIEDVGPFFELFAEVGVVEDCVDCAVPATPLHLSLHNLKPKNPGIEIAKKKRGNLQHHLRSGPSITRVVTAHQIPPSLRTLY
jgi:hypothetical protein